MIKKYLLVSFSLCSAFVFNSTAHAELKTSSLAIEKPVTVKLVPQCQNMFKVADALIRDAERQPGTHPQVKRLKNKLSSTKLQLTKMETELQQKSCDKGLTALNILKQKH